MTRDEVISRQDVLDAISRIGLFKSDTREVQAVAECLRAVEALPSVKLQEPKTGHFINIDDIKSECSECGHREPNERFIFEDINYCSKCCARMESEI